jgi:hypothetical protein
MLSQTFHEDGRKWCVLDVPLPFVTGVNNSNGATLESCTCRLVYLDEGSDSLAHEGIEASG